MFIGFWYIYWFGVRWATNQSVSPWGVLEKQQLKWARPQSLCAQERINAWPCPHCRKKHACIYIYIYICTYGHVYTLSPMHAHWIYRLWRTWYKYGSSNVVSLANTGVDMVTCFVLHPILTDIFIKAQQCEKLDTHRLKANLGVECSSHSAGLIVV